MLDGLEESTMLRKQVIKDSFSSFNLFSNRLSICVWAGVVSTVDLEGSSIVLVDLANCLWLEAALLLADGCDGFGITCLCNVLRELCHKGWVTAIRSGKVTDSAYHLRLVSDSCKSFTRHHLPDSGKICTRLVIPGA